MNYFDYFIIGIVVIGFILGFKDGLVRKIIGLIGVILGIILAIEFSNDLGKTVAPLFDNEIYFARIASGFFIFIIIFLLAAILKRVVHPHDKVNKLINQTLGGIAGVLQIIIFLSGLLFFLNLFSVPKKEIKEKSALYASIYSVLPKSVDMIIGGRGILKAYIEEQTKDKNITEPEIQPADSLKTNNDESQNKTKIKKVRFSKE